MKQIVLWCSIVIVVLGVVSCETEVDLLAPYKSVPVVYAIIDPTDDIHYVKITKTFLGDGNALDFAQVADSSIIPNLQATIEEVRGVNSRSWQLRDTIIEGKEAGDFYQDGNVVYYFQASDLTIGATLRLSFDFNGSEIIAEAPILASPNITKPRAAGANIGFITGDVYTSNWRFEEIQVEFFGIANAVQYEVSGDLMYNEVYVDGTSREKHIPMNIAKGLEGQGINNEINITYDGADFFSVVTNSVDVDENVVRRELLDYTFKVSAIDQELATYLSVNAPSSGISQERPEYSNVTSSNGEAFGLFAVVGTSKFIRPLSTITQRGLAGFPDIDNLKFCGTDPLLAPEPAVYCQ